MRLAILLGLAVLFGVVGILWLAYDVIMIAANRTLLPTIVIPFTMLLGAIGALRLRRSIPRSFSEREFERVVFAGWCGVVCGIALGLIANVFVLVPLNLQKFASAPIAAIVVSGCAVLGGWIGSLCSPRSPHLEHHCLACGYDLRGCVKAICPECGTPFDPEVVRKGE